MAAALSGEAAGTVSGILATAGPRWWQQRGMAAVAGGSIGKGSVMGSASASGRGTTAAASAPGSALPTTATTAPAARLQLRTLARPTWPIAAAGALAAGGSSSQMPSASASGHRQHRLLPTRRRCRHCPPARPRRPHRSSSGSSWLRTAPPEPEPWRWMQSMAPGGLAGAGGSSTSSSTWRGTRQGRSRSRHASMTGEHTSQLRRRATPIAVCSSCLPCYAACLACPPSHGAALHINLAWPLTSPPPGAASPSPLPLPLAPTGCANWQLSSGWTGMRQTASSYMRWLT